MAYFRLFRLPNLLIVALTQYLLYYTVIAPALRQGGIQPVFDPIHFFLFVMVTLFITACGYLANDLLDLPADQRNRPDKLLVGRHFSIHTINRWLAALATAGMWLAIYLALYVRNFSLFWIYPIAMGGLMGYNIWLKRMPLLGNIVVALYCSGTAAVLFLAEAPALKQLALKDLDLFRSSMAVLWWYTGFAFLTTLCRELVKDLEDMEGDGEAGYRTAPVVWGLTRSRGLALAFGIVLGAFLLIHAWHYRAVFPPAARVYTLLAVWLPLLAILYKLSSAQAPLDFHRVSQGFKGLMLGGLFLLYWI